MSEDVPDQESLNTAMVEFLGLFPTLSGSPPTEVSELSDGIALFEALSEIAPDYFDPTTIARHLGDNWALKSSNLRKLLRNLEHFYHEILGKDADFASITSQVAAIARGTAGVEPILELVAAAAVTCENRTEFVGHIMSMSPENQLSMKHLIEQSLGRLSDYKMDNAHEHENDGEDEDERFEENELVFGQATPAATSHRDSTSVFGNHEREELEKALMDARMELSSHQSQVSIQIEEQEAVHKKLRALVEDLQDRLEKRQIESLSLESQLKTTHLELQDANNRVQDLSEKNSQLADDLDVARGKANQLQKAEATIVAYRKKIEGVGMLNQQMTDLEDQAASYLQQIVELESDVKKIPNLNKTIDDLRAQLSLLQQDHETAGSVVRGSASEIAQLKSQLLAAESAKKMYEEELKELRAAQQASDSVSVDDGGLSSTLARRTTDAATKEKLMRLEIENKKVKQELETVKATAEANADSIELQGEISKLKDSLAKTEADRAKVINDKDKLEAYTKRTLAKFQEKYLVALQECKQKLKEKQDKIEALEGRSSSEKTAQKREERLLSSTIYELGLTIMQNRLKDR